MGILLIAYLGVYFYVSRNKASIIRQATTEIVKKINAALNDMTNDQDAKPRFTAVGAEFRSGSQKEFADFLVAQDALWGKTLSDLGVKPE